MDSRIVVGREYLKQFFDAKEEELSFTHSISETIQPKYTFGSTTAANKWHVIVLRNELLSRRIPELIPLILDELDDTLNVEMNDVNNGILCYLEIC
jgi:hypothetical protein